MSEHWVHLCQLPEEVRQTMSQAFTRWAEQDLGIEVALDLMLRDRMASHVLRQALQRATNATRIPELCRVVKAAHPGLSWRSVFTAVGLFSGLHLKHVQRLYYAERRVA